MSSCGCLVDSTEGIGRYFEFLVRWTQLQRSLQSTISIQPITTIQPNTPIQSNAPIQSSTPIQPKSTDVSSTRHPEENSGIRRLSADGNTNVGKRWLNKNISATSVYHLVVAQQKLDRVPLPAEAHLVPLPARSQNQPLGRNGGCRRQLRSS